MRVKANGRLRHHFWGDYHATIALAFDDAASAADARVTLGEAWQVSERDPRGLVWHGAGEAFDAVKARLAELGARVEPCGRKGCRSQCAGEPIDSVAHSIDLGPAFTVEVPTTPAEQASLF